MNWQNLSSVKTNKLIEIRQYLAWTSNPWKPKQTASEKRIDAARLRIVKAELTKRGIR